MAAFENTRRIGRTQAAVIFWGLVSVFFAAAFCLFFVKNRENERNADYLRGEVLSLQDQRENLSSEKGKLQASISEIETQLKTREDFLQEKEEKLGQEQSRLEALGSRRTARSSRARRRPPG